MAQHPVLDDIKPGAEVVGALGSMVATGGTDAPEAGALIADDVGELAAASLHASNAIGLVLNV